MSMSGHTTMKLSSMSCPRARMGHKAGRIRLRSLRWNMKRSLRRFRLRKPWLLKPSQKIRARQKVQKVPQTKQL